MDSSNKIKILSPEQALKISAGEVVERPVNIIKELVENSIDAQATKISIFINQAGKQLIKIIDNGCGMSPDDAKLSVAQHATSKITSVDDLQTIATFGFRGEALASINTVSKLTIITKTAGAQTGTKITWHFGKFVEESMQSHPTGTTLEIANLFDNIPARQKFLKKDETEWRAIITLFQAFCLDYCNIHFQLYNENKLQFNCPPTTNLTDRTAQLFDSHLENKIYNLVELNNKLCSLTGVISSPTYYRYDRNQIFIFVNNRWVKNIDLTKAIMRGYAGTLPAQKYPAAIIFITIDADQVDVNIHPKKEEIKFLHPKKIESVIINSIKATLEETIRHQIKPTQEIYTQQTASTYHPTFIQPAHSLPHENIEDMTFDFLEKQPTYLPIIEPKTVSIQQSQKDTASQTINTNINNFDSQPITTPQALAHTFQPTSTAVHQIPEESLQQHHVLTQEHRDINIIGQYKRTYILFEQDGNLMFIDQHAAHERILYEQFKANFHNIATIQLMFPEFIKLQPHDILALAPHLSLLQDHGISAQIFSETQLLIQATPVHLKNQLLLETIQQIIGWIKEIDTPDQTRMANILNEKIHTKMACSAAIKAGDLLNLEQMQQLLRNLYATEYRFACPHGRPTCWNLTLEMIEKKFKRNYEQKAEQFFDLL